MSGDGAAMSAEDAQELQSAYDDLVESSREIEDALTQEVADEQKRTANAERRVEELGEQLRASKASAATLKKSLAECEARLGDAEEKAAQSKVERAEMEIMVDEMEEDARRAGANDGAVQAKLERVLEDNVILTTELEASKQRVEESFERHRIEIEELQSELERLQDEQSGGTPLKLARPSMGSVGSKGEAADGGADGGAGSGAELGVEAATNPLQAGAASDGRREATRAGAGSETNDALQQELDGMRQELFQERQLRMRIESQLKMDSSGGRRSSEVTCTPGCGVQ